MARLAAPPASVAYLRIALERNPHSQSARRGMHWASQRLRDYNAAHPTQAVRVQRTPAAAPVRTQPAGMAAGLPGVIAEGTGAVAVRRPPYRTPAGAYTQPVPVAQPRAQKLNMIWALVLFVLVFGGLFGAAVLGNYLVS